MKPVLLSALLLFRGWNRLQNVFNKYKISKANKCDKVSRSRKICHDWLLYKKKKKHVTGPVHHFTSCVCVMSVVLTWAERSDAFILCSIGRSIAPRRLLSTVDLLASRLNVGGLETVDILFTLVQEVNWNRAGPFLHEWLRFLSRKKKKERETDGEIKTRQKNRTDPPVLFKFARPRYVKVWERKRCGGPGDALIGACMLGLFSCLPFSCRTGKKKKSKHLSFIGCWLSPDAGILVCS